MGYMLNAANSLADLERQRFLRQQQGQLLQLGQQHVAQNALALGQQQRIESDILGARQAAQGAPGGEALAVYKYWEKTDPRIASGIASDIMTQGQHIAAAGDPQGGIDHVNRNLGTNFQITGIKGQFMNVVNPDNGQTETLYLEAPKGGGTPTAAVVHKTGEEGGGPESVINIYRKLNPQQKLAVDAFAVNKNLPSGLQLSKPDMKEALDAYDAEQAKLKVRPDQSRSIDEMLTSTDPQEQRRAQEALRFKVRTEASFRPSGTQGATIDLTKALPNPGDESIAQMLAANKTVPEQLSRRTANYNNILARAQVINPDLNLIKAATNFRAGIQGGKVIRSLDVVLDSLDNVLAASKDYERTNIGVLNDIILKGKTEFNDPKAIAFQTAVTGVIDDAASALSGGGVVTDAGRKQATNLFRTAYSQGGMEAAIAAVKELVLKRRAGFAKGTVYEQSPGGETAPGSGNIMRRKSKSGQPIVSKDGGKTWQYE